MKAIGVASKPSELPGIKRISKHCNVGNAMPMLHKQMPPYILCLPALKGGWTHWCVLFNVRLFPYVSLYASRQLYVKQNSNLRV